MSFWQRLHAAFKRQRKKPHLKRFGGEWLCVMPNGGPIGWGKTPLDAYFHAQCKRVMQRAVW